MTHGGVSLAFVAAKLARPRVGRVSLRTPTESALRLATGRRLTVVCAPAGYGKTTAVADMAERLELNVLWYKLDVLDHDPIVTIVSLTHALQERRGDFGEVLLERIRSSAESPFGLRDAVAMFVRECFEKIGESVHIVLDDYHEAADSAELNWTLDYLLENLPSGFRVIVISRYDPAFSMSKLRLADQVALVGVEALRFDAEQVAEILQARCGRTPSPAAVERLVELTEGWPASLVLASFALEWLDVDSLETALADPRLKQDIYSYLAEQVYQREDDETQRFLEQTCYLEHITGELGNLLAGVENAEYRLNRLATKSAFTFSSQAEGAWRYHNLFREYLRQRFLQENGPAAFHRLQVRTIEALEACNDIELAVDLSLTINEPSRVLDIIARTSEPSFDSIRSETLASWVSRLNWSTAASSPWTGLLQSQVQLRQGDFDEALNRVEAALTEFADEGDELGLYHAYSAQESALFWKGNMEEASMACSAAFTHADTVARQAHTLVSIGSVAMELRDWVSAESAYAQADRLIRGIESFDRQRLATLMALMKYHQGDARAAHLEMRGINLEGPRKGCFASVLNAIGVVELAMGLYQASDLHLARALEAAEQFGSRHLIPVIQDSLGICLAARGDHETGMKLLRESAQSDTMTSDSSLLALSLCHAGTVLRRRGDLHSSLEYYRRATKAIQGTRDRYVALNAQANLQLVLGLLESDTTRSLLQTSRAAGTARLAFVQHKAALFAAMVRLLRWRDAQGAESLLETAVPELLRLGQLNLLVQEGAHSPAVASHILKAGLGRPHYEDLKHLLASDHRKAKRIAVVVIDGLTKRESEILALMAAGKRNIEIAETMYISLATVKSHVNHIFAKLGVNDRVQAVLMYKSQPRL